jgi:RNA polymerase sigma-70 factor, ECF subfamily
VGDQDGVDEAVLRALRPVILRYCRARLSHHAPDDVAQEVCLALMSARHGRQGGLSTERTVTAYPFGIAQHKVADAMRASARLAVPFPGLPDMADDRPGPEDTVLARWEGEQVLGMSAEAVRVAQHRALARMRKLLASEPG